MEFRHVLAEWLGNFSNQHFANEWIGRGGPIARPARSLDLNPLDFHLWGHLKSIENAEILRNRTRLRTNSRNTRNDRESNQTNDKTRVFKCKVVISSH